MRSQALHIPIRAIRALGIAGALLVALSAFAAPSRDPEWVDPAKANLDRDTRAVVERINAHPGPNFMSLAPEERRRVQAELFGPLGLPDADLTDVVERNIPGPGGPLRVRVYTPRPALPSGRRGLLVYFHGGGMTAGTIEQYDALCQRLARGSDAIVMSVDYRLSPEHRFPEPVNDAYASVQWAYENAATLGADRRRLAVGGDSAGGNLAAVVAQLARDRKGPPLVFQLLIYPAVGFTRDSPSMRMYSEGYLFGREELEMAIEEYVPDPAQRTDPRLFPLLAHDFSRLPPAFLISASHEIMRDDIEEYAKRLARAGVPVEVHRYEGTVHPFLSMAGAIELGRAAIDEAAHKVHAALERKQ